MTFISRTCVKQGLNLPNNDSDIKEEIIMAKSHDTESQPNPYCILAKVEYSTFEHGVNIFYL